MRFLAALSILAILFSSCKEGGDSPSLFDSYDHQSWRNYTADSIIQPALVDYHQACEDMSAAFLPFQQNPNQTHLDSLQLRFEEAYKAFMVVEGYGFGASANLQVNTFSNTFPTDTHTIHQNFTSTYDLTAVNQIDAQGFPALDYLLFFGGDSMVLENFKNKQGQLAYTQDIMGRLEQMALLLSTEWNSNYGPSFKDAAGPQVGGALGEFVNAFNFNIELSKRARIGIPVGNFSAGIPLPSKSEALYSGLSNELLIANIEARKRDFSKGGGKSLAGLLNHLNAQHRGEPLADRIDQELDLVLSTVQGFQNPVSELVISNPSQVQNTFNALQSTVVLTKVDMPSQMGVQITYQDNDGD